MSDQPYNEDDGLERIGGEPAPHIPDQNFEQVRLFGSTTSMNIDGEIRWATTVFDEDLDLIAESKLEEVLSDLRPYFAALIVFAAVILTGEAAISSINSSTLRASNVITLNNLAYQMQVAFRNLIEIEPEVKEVQTFFTQVELIHRATEGLFNLGAWGPGEWALFFEKNIVEELAFYSSNFESGEESIAENFLLQVDESINILISKGLMPSAMKDMSRIEQLKMLGSMGLQLNLVESGTPIEEVLPSTSNTSAKLREDISKQDKSIAAKFLQILASLYGGSIAMGFLRQNHSLVKSDGKFAIERKRRKKGVVQESEESEYEKISKDEEKYQAALRNLSTADYTEMNNTDFERQLRLSIDLKVYRQSPELWSFMVSEAGRRGVLLK